MACAGWTEETEYATLDRMFVKAETPMRAVVGRGQIKLLAYHTYPTTLRRFKVVAESEHLESATDPTEMAQFKPTTIEAFTLNLTVKGQPKSDRVELLVGMTSDELRSTKQFSILVPLTESAALEINESLVIPVGEIEVYVKRFGEEIYYLYVFPTLAILGWLIWRKRTTARMKSDA